MVRITEGWSGSCCIGILDFSITLIKSIIISSIAFDILIETWQRFVKVAMIQITKNKHRGVWLILKMFVNTVM